MLYLHIDCADSIRLRSLARQQSLQIWIRFRAKKHYKRKLFWICWTLIPKPFVYHLGGSFVNILVTDINKDLQERFVAYPLCVRKDKAVSFPISFFLSHLYSIWPHVPVRHLLRPSVMQKHLCISRTQISSFCMSTQTLQRLYCYNVSPARTSVCLEAKPEAPHY